MLDADADGAGATATITAKRGKDHHGLEDRCGALGFRHPTHNKSLHLADAAVSFSADCILFLFCRMM